VTSEPNVLVASEGRVRVVTLNRPDRLNAFDNALYDAVSDALEQAEHDPTVHVVVLTGAGRAFSAGADRAPLVPHSRSSFERFLTALSITKPLIAAVNGVAVGIGLTMLPHCDLVLVDASARLRAPFTALGVAPEASSSHLIASAIGPQHAARLLYTSDWVSAEEAVALGLALSVSPEGTVLADAIALASRIAEFPLASLQATRRTLLAARSAAVAAAHAAEQEVWKTLRLPPFRPQT
jgi:enoyl-CoA hydratase/carnithine racemase